MCGIAVDGVIEGGDLAKLPVGAMAIRVSHIPSRDLGCKMSGGDARIVSRYRGCRASPRRPERADR